MDLATANQLVGLGTLALQALTVLLIVAYLLRNRSESARAALASIAPFAFPVAFVASLIGSAITLFYSAVLGLEPCPLCWWQRVFLYPQVILFALAMWKKDVTITLYAIALSFVGGAIALYQHALQMLPGSGLPCPAAGVSCAQRFLFEFGYITYPLAALTLFTFLAILMLIARRQ